jgi:hypothetical protein
VFDLRGVFKWLRKTLITFVQITYGRTINRWHTLSTLSTLWSGSDRLCGPVVRAPSYRSRSPGFDSQRYQIFWEVVGLEQGPLNLMSIIEELLGRNNSGSGLENREYGHADHTTLLYPQKLAPTSPTRGLHSVCIVRLRTKAREFWF